MALYKRNISLYLHFIFKPCLSTPCICKINLCLFWGKKTNKKNPKQLKIIVSTVMDTTKKDVKEFDLESVRCKHLYSNV